MKHTNKLLIQEPPLQVLPSLAVILGLVDAIIVQQIHYWLERSTNEKHGRKWVWNSYPSWQGQFPFWSVDTIKRAILRLEKQGILLSASYNKMKIDKTKWYSIDYEALEIFIEKKIDHEGNLPPRDKGNLPLPIPENTTRDYHIKEPEQLGSLKEELVAQQKERTPAPKKGLSDLTVAIRDYWNELASSPSLVVHPSKHKNTITKGMRKAEGFLDYLVSGTLVKNCTELTSEWCAENKINMAYQNKKWSPDEIKGVIDNYFLHFQKEYWPFTKHGKEGLPKSLDAFLYSPASPHRKSYFLLTAVAPPKKKTRVLDERVLEVLVDTFAEIDHAPNKAEVLTLEDAANGIVHWYRRLDASIAPACSIHYSKQYRAPLSLAVKFRDFLRYLYSNERNDMICHPGMFKPGSKTWTAFLHFAAEEWHAPINVDFEDEEHWAFMKLQTATTEFRRKVEEHGLEKARRLYGERIPYITSAEYTRRNTEWMATHKNARWGMGLYEEIKAGRI